MKTVSHPCNDLMSACIELARESLDRGSYPIGSIVVDKCGCVLGKGRNTLLTDVDPTGHPEILAIREACQSVKSRYLEGAFLYSTLEPCPMCTAAAIWAKMAGIVYGSSQADAIAYSQRNKSQLFTWRQIEVPCEHVVERGTPRLKVFRGVERDRCNALFLLTRGK